MTTSTPSLHATLASFAVPDDVVSTVLMGAAQAEAQGCRAASAQTEDYVSVTIAGDHPIAAYVDKGGVSIALEPPSARQAVERQPYLAVDRSNATTSIVRARSSVLDDPVRRCAVAELVNQALQRSSTLMGGTGATRRANHDEVPAEQCPTHFVAMLGGVCADCD